MYEDILVSIVMPIYNSKKYLSESIDSILKQTHSNWEFIIINEFGSNDGSLEILNQYAKSDSRFVIVQNKERLGISASMNIGLDLANGKYIARMDADDISNPDRFEKQIKFMEEHPDIAMCGSCVKIFGSRAFDWKMEFDPDVIHSNLLFYSPCVHPSIMMRASFMRENNLKYNPKYKASEDYDLFSRIGACGKISNVNDVLFRYRLEDDNTTFKNNDIGLKIYLEIISSQISALGISLSDEELDLLSPHGKFNALEGRAALIEFEKLELILKRIYSANLVKKVYVNSALIKTLNKRFTEAYYQIRKKVKVSLIDSMYHNSILSYTSIKYEKCKCDEEPIITVLIPTYNSQDHIADTLWSILNQTEKRFEILIINEYGSNDDTVLIAESFGDERIRIIQNESRLGLAESLNLGIKAARGKYIARCDADDTSHPDRLKKQMEYMDSHPRCGLCGSWQHHYSSDYEWTHKTVVDSEDVRAELLYNCDICHSTVMLRKEMFVDNMLYYDNTRAAEDWELWIRAAEKMDMYNIPEVLGEYREGVDNITTTKMEKLSKESGELTGHYIKKYFGIDVDPDFVPYLTGWENKFYDGSIYDEDKLAIEKKLICEIYKKNQAVKCYNQKSLLRTLNKRWLTDIGCWNGHNPVVSLKVLFKINTGSISAKCYLKIIGIKSKIIHT